MIRIEIVHVVWATFKVRDIDLSPVHGIVQQCLPDQTIIDCGSKWINEIDLTGHVASSCQSGTRMMRAILGLPCQTKELDLQVCYLDRKY